ncbi:MAG: hypothetical protein ABI681_04225 [Gemmatimonadales bacterium]
MREVRLLEVLGRKVVDSSGKHIGRLEEIEVERGDDSCAIKSYIVEHRGLLDRTSSWAVPTSIRLLLAKRRTSAPYRVRWEQMDMSDPRHPKALLPSDELERTR